LQLACPEAVQTLWDWNSVRGTTLAATITVVAKATVCLLGHMTTSASKAFFSHRHGILKHHVHSHGCCHLHHHRLSHLRPHHRLDHLLFLLVLKFCASSENFLVHLGFANKQTFIHELRSVKGVSKQPLGMCAIEYIPELVTKDTV
jgi:hypothetical protein